MNLKYYLRGMGLGILVTALILGIAGSQNKRMTDEQIKARALELGMIENTVLTKQPATESEQLTEPLEETKEQEPEESTQELQETETKAPAEEVSSIEEENAIDEEQLVEESSETEKTDETDGADGDGTADVKETEETESDDTQTEEPTQDSGNEVSKPEESTQKIDSTVVLTIVGGDTSFSVARKLADLGVVSSVNEYDHYLCTNGYDKSIRTGTYEITPEMTLEQIARMINGK